MKEEINGNALVELIGIEASDEKVLEVFTTLGMDMPLFDEQFEFDGRIAVYDNDKTLDIAFVENEDMDNIGEPIVKQVDFYNENKVSFPLDLHKNDDYETVIKKLGRKPDFCDNILDTFKQWVFQYKDKEITYCVQFKKGFKSINTIVVSEFNRESVEKSEYIFPCSELE